MVAWQKEGARLPASASEREGDLVISSASLSDAGTYICTGSNQRERRDERVVVRVVPVRPVRPVRPPTSK